jgi:hypothetical protein
VKMSCHAVLDTGQSGFRGLLTTDAGGCPAACYFLCFAKESRQRKAASLHRSFGVPKISHQQRAARKLVARGVGFVLSGFRRSPIRQRERTAPVAGAKFWRSNMGDSKARSLGASFHRVAVEKTTVILSVAEGSALLSANGIANSPRKLRPRTSMRQERRIPSGEGLSLISLVQTQAYVGIFSQKCLKAPANTRLSISINHRLT